MGGGSGGGWNVLGNLESLEAKAKAALQEGRKNVFISFVAEDLAEVNLLRGQAKSELSDIEFNDHSVREPYNSDRAEYIRGKITDRINRASVTVVYLSDKTAHSKWVKFEVEKSIELGKKVIATHAGSTAPSKMPQWAKENAIKVVPWNKLAAELK